jgi:hypothetical protein
VRDVVCLCVVDCSSGFSMFMEFLRGDWFVNCRSKLSLFRLGLGLKFNPRERDWDVLGL